MWHKDTAIAVDSNRGASKYFSRPTVKAGVPHVVAVDEILRQMLTLRIHLDEVTDENGPLKVIPDHMKAVIVKEKGSSTPKRYWLSKAR